jgi:ribosomal protein L40E
VSEGGGTEVAEPAFCGACGAEIDAAARFCRSCGADQLQFAEPEPELESEPESEVDSAPGEAEPEAAPEVAPVAVADATAPPQELPRLLDVLSEQRGFAPSQPPSGGPDFSPAERGVVGALGGLPVRVDEGTRPEDGAALIRVRLGLANGDPDVVEKALQGASAWRVCAAPTGVEILATAEHCGKEAEAALAYVEDLAQRAAGAKEAENSTPAAGARALTVCGYPQWVQTPDTSDVEGVDLAHFELRDGAAEWDELALRMAPSADGAMLATGVWDEEAPFISLMGRIAIVRAQEGGGETALVLGSGVCTLTNRRLLGVIYARPDDDVLESLGQGIQESGITMRDASGRSVNPLLAMPEEDKIHLFVDQSGAVDEEGGGVVLALSAFPSAFARVDLEGGVLARGLGIPRVRLSGGPLELTIVPFRVLDPNSHTVKPRLGQIKNAVNAWWAMTAPDSQ